MNRMSLSIATYKTHLPMANVEEANQRVPQHNAVSWAFWAGRKLLGEPLTARVVLVAYAQFAESALFGPDGYSGTRPEDVASLIGISTATVRRYTKTLEHKGLLTSRGLGYRVPDAAIDATWVG